MQKTHRILGIDPGTAIVGWGIIDVDEHNDVVSAVAYGCITTDKELRDEDRLHAIATDLEELIETYVPTCTAVEELFYFKNAKTVITVAQARGVILHTCHRAGLPIASYTPLQIKQALTGYGRADKKQVQNQITKTLELTKIPEPDDTADALAVALCHKRAMRFKEVLTTAK